MIRPKINRLISKLLTDEEFKELINLLKFNKLWEEFGKRAKIDEAQPDMI